MGKRKEDGRKECEHKKNKKRYKKKKLQFVSWGKGGDRMSKKKQTERKKIN